MVGNQLRVDLSMEIHYRSRESLIKKQERPTLTSPFTTVAPKVGSDRPKIARIGFHIVCG